MEWGKLLYVLLAGLLAWLAYRNIRGNPEAFSKANMNKSLRTLAVLALILIGFIALCVMLLRG